MIRCALARTSRRSQLTPPPCSASTSSNSAFGSMTTPLPITGVTSGESTPDGRTCSAYFSSPITTVWPALLPPWYLTTYCTLSPSRSVALPLPSSPHWAPISTMAGILFTPFTRRKPLAAQARQGLLRCEVTLITQVKPIRGVETRQGPDVRSVRAASATRASRYWQHRRDSVYLQAL